MELPVSFSQPGEMSHFENTERVYHPSSSPCHTPSLSMTWFSVGLMDILDIESRNDPSSSVILDPFPDLSLTMFTRQGSTDEAGVKVHPFFITCDGIEEDISANRSCIMTVSLTAEKSPHTHLQNLSWDTWWQIYVGLCLDHDSHNPEV